MTWKPKFKFNRGPMRDQVTSERMNHILDGVSMAQPAVAGHTGIKIRQTPDGWTASLKGKGGGGKPRSFRVYARPASGSGAQEGYVSTGTIYETSEGYVPRIWAGADTGVAVEVPGTWEIEDTDTAFSLTDDDVNIAYIKITTTRESLVNPVGTDGYTHYRNVTRMQVIFSTSGLDHENPSGTIQIYYLPVGHITLASGAVTQVRSYIEQTPIFECHPSAVDLEVEGLPDGSLGDIIYHDGTEWTVLAKPTLGSWRLRLHQTSLEPTWEKAGDFAVTHVSGRNVSVNSGRIVGGTALTDGLLVSGTTITVPDNATTTIYLNIGIESNYDDLVLSANTIRQYIYRVDTADVNISTTQATPSFDYADPTADPQYRTPKIATVTAAGGVVTSIVQNLPGRYFELADGITYDEVVI